MLSRLLKYEWKSSGKITLLLNGYIILITVCGIVMLRTGIFTSMIESGMASHGPLPILSTIAILLTGAYFISMIAVAIAVVLFQIVRFYKNYYTDEGYLMHTLPVSSSQLILSKGLFAFGAILLTSAVLMLSFFSILFAAVPAAERRDMIDIVLKFVPTVAREIGWPHAAFILYMIALTIISVTHSILAFYTALSIGQRFAKHKVIGAIIAYAVMNMAEQILSLILMVLSGWTSFITNPDAAATARFVRRSCIFSCIFTLGIVVVYWLITNHMMKNRLNLE